VPEWARRNVKIQNSERASFFDPMQTPWLIAPLECASDHETRQVVLLAPTGSGKSTLAEGLIPYVVSEDPGNFLYASQTDPDAKFWAETRLQPSMKSCQQIAELWPKDRHKSRALEIIFPHMALILGGANLSNFQEKSCRWLYGDEVWAWKAGLLREFLARHHNRWNRKVFLVSQGGDEGGELDLEWLKTEQSSFGWKCESCGNQHPFDFAHLKYDEIKTEKGELDEYATAETTRKACPSCQAEYEDNVMTRRRLAESNLENGSKGYIAKPEAKAQDGMRGFHVDSTAVWWIEWKTEVLAYLEAVRLVKAGNYEKMRQWTQKRRARAWNEEQVEEKVEVTAGDFAKADHEDGKPIDNEAHRFMTIDVGGNHFWAIIQAWRNGGSSRILWEGYVPSVGGDEDGLRDLQIRYNVPNAHVLIDVGFESPRIYDLMAVHGWMGVKGVGTRESFPATLRDGKKIERLFSKTYRAKSTKGPLVPYVLMATNPLKDIAHRLITGEGAELELPADVSKVFIEHMQSESKATLHAPKNGLSRVWVTKKRANHLWDCLVYQVGAAMIRRVFGDD